MNEDENKLKKALDDIFGDDFIEIKSGEGTKAEEKKDNSNNFDDIITSLEASLKESSSNETNKEKIEDDKKTYEAIDNSSLIKSFNVEAGKKEIENTEITGKVVNDTSMKEENERLVVDSDVIDKAANDLPLEEKEESSDTDSVTDKGIVPQYKAIDNDLNDNVRSDNKGMDSNRIVLIIVAVLIFLVVISYVVTNILTSEKKEYCYYEAKDTGYKNTDSYTITHKLNKIIYVEGMYEYVALADEYKDQIEAIKDEKLPVIINSNGLSGFTHSYDISDNSITVMSFYDVMLFDKGIDKNDEKINPLSYINIKTTTKYKDLVKSLEKKGYTCSNSK